MSMNRPHGGAQVDFRRLFDAACSAAGLVLLAPVYVCLALFVLLDDGPPVFFSQIRIGKNGRPFRIWKFRTMSTKIPGGLLTAANDPRITRAGAVLRRRKLDELPQLFNVVMGDFCVVGARPDFPDFLR